MMMSFQKKLLFFLFQFWHVIEFFFSSVFFVNTQCLLQLIFTRIQQLLSRVFSV